MPGLAAVPGIVTLRSLMRPRSDTNTDELTPVALSSGIASADGIAAESVRSGPGSPVGSASGIS